MAVAEWVPAGLEIPSGYDLISGLLTGRIQKVGKILVVSGAIGKSTKNNTRTKIKLKIMRNLPLCFFKVMDLAEYLD